MYILFANKKRRWLDNIYEFKITTMNTKKNYYWNEDTINHFQFMTSYTSGEEVYNEIQEFVENNCEIEENEVEQDLIDDLVRQVGL